jgi:phosphoribosylaminoimidazole-succinocarboxamide synthase
MADYNKGELKYEGKAKRLYACDKPHTLVMEFKDDLTAFDAEKRGNMAGKGAVNNKVSALIMGALNEMGIETTFVELLDENHSLVKDVDIVQVEVIVRYEAQGSFCRRYGIEPGLPIDPPLLEIGYKNDDLHDPFFSDDAVPVLMELATHAELKRIRYLALVVGEKLREIYLRQGIRLIDFKLEFGRLKDPEARGRIVLADEVTPDTCRLVDAATGEKLDKDLFRFDMGDIAQGYNKLLEKMSE